MTQRIPHFPTTAPACHMQCPASAHRTLGSLATRTPCLQHASNGVVSSHRASTAVTHPRLAPQLAGAHAACHAPITQLRHARLPTSAQTLLHAALHTRATRLPAPAPQRRSNRIGHHCSAPGRRGRRQAQRAAAAQTTYTLPTLVHPHAAAVEHSQDRFGAGAPDAAASTPSAPAAMMRCRTNPLPMLSPARQRCTPATLHASSILRLAHPFPAYATADVAAAGTTRVSHARENPHV
ncbi:hypothetical protein COO60DRAFT_957698 [Scenedesmus sp. NREL 46B-D3]|nr:hypothetical protein COO60DRAFT_957698 [Scenedesmus sp. NREL 46B-D3]